MKNRILLPRKAIKDLEHIAKLFFPMEIDAKLSVVKKDEKNFIERIALSNYNYDGRVYEYSEDFDRLINCLRVNNVWEEEINSLIKNKKESQKLFLNYKECQKRNAKSNKFENICYEFSHSNKIISYFLLNNANF